MTHHYVTCFLPSKQCDFVTRPFFFLSRPSESPSFHDFLLRRDTTRRNCALQYNKVQSRVFSFSSPARTDCIFYFIPRFFLQAKCANSRFSRPAPRPSVSLFPSLCRDRRVGRNFVNWVASETRHRLHSSSLHRSCNGGVSLSFFFSHLPTCQPVFFSAAFVPTRLESVRSLVRARWNILRVLHSLAGVRLDPDAGSSLYDYP